MGSGMQRFRTVVAEQDSGDRRYDTVLFDLYGTLVDIRTDEDDPEAWETLRDFLDEAGAHYDSADQLRHRRCRSGTIRRSMSRTCCRPTVRCSRCAACASGNG